MIRKGLWTVLFTISMLGTASAACPPHRPATYLSYKIETTEYIRDKDAGSLTDLHTAAGANTVLGLAGGEVGTRFEATFEAEPQGNNLYCLNLKTVSAVFYARPMIHIAKNFARGTCEYNAVLKHENKHVTVLKRAHKEYLPKFQKHLRVTSKKVPVLPPMSLQDANQRKHDLTAQIGQDLNDYLTIIMEDVAQRQAEVDSEEEYQRIHDRCSRWEKRLAGE